MLMALSTFDSPIPTPPDPTGSAERRLLLEKFGLLSPDISESPDVPPPSPSSLPAARTLLHRRLQALVQASEGTTSEIGELVAVVAGATNGSPTPTTLAKRLDAVEESIRFLRLQTGTTPITAASMPGDGFGNVRTPLSEAQLICFRALHSVEQLLFEADSASSDPTKRKAKTKSGFDELRASKLGRDAREELTKLGQADVWDTVTQELGDPISSEVERSMRVVLCQKLRVSVLRDGPQR
jgi:hypothetical protein